MALRFLVLAVIPFDAGTGSGRLVSPPEAVVGFGENSVMSSFPVFFAGVSCKALLIVSDKASAFISGLGKEPRANCTARLQYQ